MYREVLCTLHSASPNFSVLYNYGIISKSGTCPRVLRIGKKWGQNNTSKKPQETNCLHWCNPEFSQISLTLCALCVGVVLCAVCVCVCVTVYAVWSHVQIHVTTIAIKMPSCNITPGSLELSLSSCIHPSPVPGTLATTKLSSPHLLRA